MSRATLERRGGRVVTFYTIKYFNKQRNLSWLMTVPPRGRGLVVFYTLYLCHQGTVQRALSTRGTHIYDTHATYKWTGNSHLAILSLRLRCFINTKKFTFNFRDPASTSNRRMFIWAHKYTTSNLELNVTYVTLGLEFFAKQIF